MKTKETKWRVCIEGTGQSSARKTFTRIYYDNRIVFSTHDSGRGYNDALKLVEQWEKSGYVPKETKKVYADYGSARAGGNAFLTRQREIDKAKAEKERRSA